jgi:SIR2-like domain
MIDAIDSLAFSMHANKGVYALLLGSGVSRAAKIPTGWDITNDLIRKVAALESADCGTDPAAWFQKTKSKTADYSELLNALTKTPTERQQLLRPYWEPNDEERDEGAKLPTKAHRAIADLIKSGYVRVVLTTNFDRLLETALHEVGIQPTVLSTPDQIDGALPLIHTPCTIIKIHGDYLDTRIRNTPEELADYPEQFNKLLERIFDEFGLIVSGWSADWDEALRAAMIRAPYRRFSTYWASRGDPSEKAVDLIARKGATLVRVADADSLFQLIGEKVMALEEFSRPHPISTQAAVTSLKKYLSDRKYRIALDDLLKAETNRGRTSAVTGAPDVNNRELNGTTIEHCLKSYESALETMIHLGFVGGQWCEDDQLAPWLRAVTALAHRPHRSGVTVWLDLQRYPSTLLLYSFGVGAAFCERWSLLSNILNTVIREEHVKDKRAVEVLTIRNMFSGAHEPMKLIPGKENHHAPLSERIQELLWDRLSSSFASQEELILAFDRFEVLAALSYAAPSIGLNERYWAPPGAFGWRSENRVQIINSIRESLNNHGDGSPFVQTGLVGKTSKMGLENLTSLENFVAELRWGW